MRSTKTHKFLSLLILLSLCVLFASGYLWTTNASAANTVSVSEIKGKIFVNDPELLQNSAILNPELVNNEGTAREPNTSPLMLDLYPADISEPFNASPITERTMIDLSKTFSGSNYQDVPFTMPTKGFQFEVGREYKLVVNRERLADVNCMNLNEVGWLNPSSGADVKGIVEGVVRNYTSTCVLLSKGETRFKVDSQGSITYTNKPTPEGLNIQTLTPEKGIDFKLYVGVESPYTRALTDTIRNLVSIINSAVTTLSGWIEAVLEYSTAIDNVQPIWLTIRNISLTLLSLGILIIAFANVLSIDIQQYGVARLIPKLTINVVLTYFSFFIVKFLLEVANILQIQFFGLMDSVGVKELVKPISYCLGTVDTVTDTCRQGGIAEIMGNFGTIILLIVLFVGVIIALAYITLILVARVVAVKFLVIVAPVALILGIMPFTEFLEKRWWSETIKWVFMGPAVAGTLLIAAIITAGIPSQIGPSSELAGKTDVFAGMVGVVLAGIAYYLAAQIPMMMGGEGMKAWKQGLSGFNKWAQKRSGIEQFRKDRAAAAEERTKQKVDAGRSWLARRKTPGLAYLGRKAAGVNTDQAKRLQLATMSNLEKKYEELITNDQFADASRQVKKGSLQEQALLRVMTKNGNTADVGKLLYGWNPAGTEEQKKRAEEQGKAWGTDLINRHAPRDRNIAKNALDEHLDLAVKTDALRDAAKKKISGRNANDITPKDLNALEYLQNEHNDPTLRQRLQDQNFANRLETSGKQATIDRYHEMQDKYLPGGRPSGGEPPTAGAGAGQQPLSGGQARQSGQSPQGGGDFEGGAGI